ncbi:MAG TPA: CDP-glycerol glycerophosphotransferase family protein [Marmoricola sp.]|nr:CDP-glycerol glycerophosphotransferase family protein [Marmoricola sp.]
MLATSGDAPGAGDLDSRPTIAATPFLGRLVLDETELDLLLDDGSDVDGVTSALALLELGFEVTTVPAYRDDRLVAPPPFSVRTDPLTGLADRIARDARAQTALVDSDAARPCFAAGAVRSLRPLLEAAETTSDDDWRKLADHAAPLTTAAGDRLDDLDVVTRVLARLAADDRRDDLVALVTARRFAGADFATHVVDGEVHADLGVDVEPRDLLVAPHESGLRAVARRLVVDGDDLVVELFAGISHLDQVESPDVEVALVAGDRRIACDASVAEDHAVDVWFGESEHDHRAGAVTVRCPVAALAEGDWRIELTLDIEGIRRSGQVGELDRQGSAGRRGLPIGDLAARFGQAPDGVRLRLTSQGVPHPAEIESVDAGAHGIHVTLRNDPDRVWLEGAGAVVEGVPQHGGTWALPLTHDVWGLGEHPLPTGSYRLLSARSGARQPTRLVADRVDLLPAELRSHGHRVRVLRGEDDGLVVRLDPLLTDDETGSRAQRRLQTAHASVTEPLDPRLVYFQSFTGQWANDHPLAIQQELARRRPDVDVRWLVADASAPAPAGTEPVLFRSRDWYDVLARAGHLVTNIELERWFRRRQGQQILQTFHGYPSKTMGLGLWRSRGLLPSHLEQQLDHTSRTWNALLTPDPSMDEHYRREYAYDGRILALGYPRDDVLVGPRRREIRNDTRHRLGIHPGQRAVLYAPTWRDDLASNFRAAEAVHHLDVEEAATALGDDYVLLLRGHRFHAGGGTPGSRVIDVTSYPDVNDLILASDVAVLDYSSMRFDFALTGRPMVFLVPDLDDYGSRTRGFLWDFGETAPGPWVRDTPGVVAALRDVDGLAARWAEQLAAFNARYNALQDGHAAERVVADFFADLPVTDA